MDPNGIEAQLSGILWPVKSILSRNNMHYTFYIIKPHQDLELIPSVSCKKIDTLSSL